MRDPGGREPRTGGKVGHRVSETSESRPGLGTCSGIILVQDPALHFEWLGPPRHHGEAGERHR